MLSHQLFIFVFMTQQRAGDSTRITWLTICSVMATLLKVRLQCFLTFFCLSMVSLPLQRLSFSLMYLLRDRPPAPHREPQHSLTRAPYLPRPPEASVRGSRCFHLLLHFALDWVAYQTLHRTPCWMYVQHSVQHCTAARHSTAAARGGGGLETFAAK